MRYLFGLMLLGLAACGGGGDTPTPGAPTLTPVPLVITKGAGNCLVSSNADATANYLLGAGQARTLLWNCANVNAQTRGAEAFFAFDNGSQCYLEEAIVSQAANCTARASAPAVPVLSAVIVLTATPNIIPIGGGSYALQPLDTQVTNTGNLTGFGLSIEVGSSPLHFATQQQIGGTAATLSGRNGLIPSTQVIHNFIPIVSNQTVHGQQYTITLSLKDFFGNTLSTTSANVTAQ